MPPSRFLFRMTYYQNLQTFLSSGGECSKNNPLGSPRYRISYDDIVARRGTTQFTTPCGSTVNDFVPFYFSPCTKMAYSIHKGNVPLRAPDGTDLGIASMEDVAYMVSDPSALFASGRACWFTDISCNSAIAPNYKNDPASLATHVEWPLFDDFPKMGQIPEIGYDGVCRWQHDRDQPIAHQMRSKKRMAEFMVRDYLHMSEVSCIVLKDHAHLEEVQAWVEASPINIPVYVKPGCYF